MLERAGWTLDATYWWADPIVNASGAHKTHRMTTAVEIQRARDEHTRRATVELSAQVAALRAALTTWVEELRAAVAAVRAGRKP